jgi:acetolactate synthase-1/2/3 large subunit
VKAVVRAINESKKPLMVWGKGVVLGAAEKELIVVIEKGEIPAVRNFL